MQDPFPAVKRELEEAFNQLKQQIQQKSRNVSNNVDLQEQILELLNDVMDLEKAVLMSEKQPSRFGLLPGEVEKRKLFVKDMKRQLQELQGKIDNPVAVASSAALNSNIPSYPPSYPTGKNTLGNGTNKNPYTHFDAAKQNKPNNAYAEMETQQQQVVMREQDLQLDGVLSTVRNLKEMANTIGDEVDDQLELLDDVDVRVDKTSSRLQQAQKRVDAIVKELASGGQCTMICLIVVLFILLILVIVT